MAFVYNDKVIVIRRNLVEKNFKRINNDNMNIFVFVSLEVAAGDPGSIVGGANETESFLNRLTRKETTINDK